MEDMKGNNLADHWAGSGAKLDGMDSDFIRSASIFDHQAFLIRNRLIASVQQGGCRATVIDREPKVPERGFMPILRTLGHEPIRTGNQIECLACGQNWHSRQTREVVSRGLCPGLSIWSVVDMQLHRPIALQPAVGLIYNGHPIHYTHRLKWHRGMLYCCRCGAYSVSRVVKLRKQCLLRPSPAARRGLKDIKQGVFPILGRDWPLPEGSIPPQLLLREQELGLPT